MLVRARGSLALLPVLALFAPRPIPAADIVTGADVATAQGYLFIDLGTLGGSSTVAHAINNGDEIVGSSLLAGDALTHATLWNGSTTPTGGGAIDWLTLPALLAAAVLARRRREER